jgi:D-amino-acid oxidase
MSPHINIWWSSLVPSFQELSTSSLPPGTNFAAGISYQTFCISPSLYLQHLLSLCVKLGAKQCKAEISSLADAFQLPTCEKARGLVNCTGLSAGKLVPDEAMFPTKGQTIVVKGKADRVGVRSGSGWEALVVPRPGSNETLLGGCKLVDDWSVAKMPSMDARKARPLTLTVGVPTLTPTSHRRF